VTYPIPRATRKWDGKARYETVRIIDLRPYDAVMGPEMVVLSVKWVDYSSKLSIIHFTDGTCTEVIPSVTSVHRMIYEK
jgi:hypothetical protein